MITRRGFLGALVGAATVAVAWPVVRVRVVLPPASERWQTLLFHSCALPKPNQRVRIVNIVDVVDGGPF